MKSLKTWIVTDGKIGTEKQCLALASLLNLTPEVKRIQARNPWKFLPPRLWFCPLKGLSAKGNLLNGPWPQVIIGSSRIAAAPLAAIKKLLGPKILVIYIQNPHLDPAKFDFIIAPSHDELVGKNVISITGAMAFLKKETLRIEAKKWEKLLPSLPRPLATIMLGGNSRHHSMTLELMKEFGGLIRKAALKNPMGFLITASRRTPSEALTAFKEALQDTPAYFWDGTGDNPYLGFLGLADFLVVTTDSVSMISEALTTEKSVYVLELKSRSNRLSKFISDLKEKGFVRNFMGTFDKFSYPPLRDHEEVLKKIEPRLKALSSSNH
ncbi:MAG: mitochondrial fission ELM1 family protein [Alphaproteobacteria bacterium]